MLAQKGRGWGAALVLFFAVVWGCNAENNALNRNVLSNRDVVILAKAGFDEQFLVNVIVSSRTHFDTGAEALAALAEQGVTQRIVEIMMNPGIASVAPAGAPAPPVAEVSKPVRASKISPARLAIMQNAPYYETKSVFFGLWKKKVGVATVPLKETSASHLGSLYAQQKYLPLGGSQAQTVQYAVAR